MLQLAADLLNTTHLHNGRLKIRLLTLRRTRFQHSTLFTPRDSHQLVMLRTQFQFLKMVQFKLSTNLREMPPNGGLTMAWSVRDASLVCKTRMDQPTRVFTLVDLIVRWIAIYGRSDHRLLRRLTPSSTPHLRVCIDVAIT